MAKTDKICIVCGEKFQGTAKSECCGVNCRKKLERLKKAGKKPEYALVGGKNTKSTKPNQSHEDKSTNKPADPPKEIIRKPFINDAIRKKLGLKD